MMSFPFLLSVLLVVTMACDAATTTGASATPIPLQETRTTVSKLLIRPIRGGASRRGDHDADDETSDTKHHPAATEPLIDDLSLKQEEDDEEPILKETTPTSAVDHTATPPDSSSRRKIRHTPEVIHKLLERNGFHPESFQLRQLMESRAEEYLQELDAASGAVGGKRQHHLPHPKSFLNYVAPKIPAITRSPDITLRIQSARPDVDAGDAACVIGMTGRLCTLYDRRTKKDDEPSAASIIKDRRFEQLVECVLCGVDVKSSTKRKFDSPGTTTTAATNVTTSEDVEELLAQDEFRIEMKEGMSARDCCRAAWGLALLGGYHLGAFSGGSVEGLDILRALGDRVRDLLLSRLQDLRHCQVTAGEERASLSFPECFNQDADDLAEDAAIAMWAFACVKACTGLRSPALFETCCSILCQNPAELLLKFQSEQNWNVTEEAVELFEDLDAVDDMALFERLSPNEATDVMWGLALHGSTGKEKSTKLELTLSETASVLREVAFDRISEYLQSDLELMKRKKEPKLKEASGKPVHVEVVDAAAILKAEEATTEVVATMEENITVQKYSAAEGATAVQQVQVVDAAALLGDSVPGVETEMIVTSSSVPSSQTVDYSDEVSTTSDEDREENVGGDLPTEQSRDQPIFSNHDLCSIAWAVTDLGDSIRNSVVDTVTDVLFGMGKTACISSLLGTDLANIAWAIARRSQELDLSQGETERASTLLTLSLWIAERSLELIQSSLDEAKEASDAVNQQFQPPELGRLMWSLASTLSRLYSVSEEEARPDQNVLNELSKIALQTADWDVSIFGTEDLARVTWGFLTLCDLESLKGEIGVMGSLGRAVSTMEGSILRWESGQCSSPAKSSMTPEETVRFASFLGKSRHSVSMLDQRIGAYDEEEDDDDAGVTEAPNNKLPLLRDLSMDPATLCKVASGLSQLEQGAWHFVRVTVRLLTAKRAQLLKDCRMSDIVHLTYACAANTVSGYEREYVARLLARRVLEIVNERFEHVREGGDIATTLRISAPEAARLIWSLGQLGVKHQAGSSDSSAYRKLRLVIGHDFVSEAHLEKLTTTQLIELLHGAVSLGLVATRPEFVHRVLRTLRESLVAEDPTASSSEAFLDLLECVCHIMGEIKGREDWDLGEPESTKHPDKSIRDEVKSVNETETETSPTQRSEMTSEHAYVRNALLTNSQEVAGLITSHLSKLVPVSPPRDLRRTLLLVSNAPIQCDEVVDTISEEVEQRLKILMDGIDLESAKSDAQLFATEAVDAAESITSESPLAALRNGLKSLFGSRNQQEEEPNGSGEQEENEEETPEQLLNKFGDMLSQTGSSTLELTRRINLRQRVTSSNVDVMWEVAFELGRCLELVETYRRIDFDSGTRGSRYDRGRRNDMSKRLLGRLFV